MNLQTFPSEILHFILLHVDPKTLVKCERVSKRFLFVMSSVWRALYRALVPDIFPKDLLDLKLYKISAYVLLKNQSVLSKINDVVIDSPEDFVLWLKQKLPIQLRLSNMTVHDYDGVSGMYLCISLFDLCSLCSNGCKIPNDYQGCQSFR